MEFTLEDLKREDVCRLVSYVDTVNRLLRITIPIIGIDTCREILKAFTSQYKILEGSKISDNGVLVSSKMTEILNGHSGGVGLVMVFGAFNGLIAEILKTYASMSSLELSTAALITAASEASREKLETIEASKEELEHKVEERTRDLSHSQKATLNMMKDLQEAYKKLRDTQDVLIQAEKLNAVGRLASGVAHEVKNPLGIIRQGIDFLENELSPVQKETLDVFQMIKNNIERADNIVRALVDFSRASRLERKPEDINSILKISLNLVQHRIKLENIKIVKEIGGDLPKISVDKGRIEQVFINILLNALQAMPNGGKLFARTYLTRLKELKNGVGRRNEDSFRKGEAALIVEIEDTGVGISQENLKKAFDPFFTMKGPRGGSGLGLSVTKNIIEMHKGLIEIKSEEGKGAKVIITLKI